MAYDPKKHHRRSIRLRGYDYTSPGFYFVTVCSFGKELLFGEISGGQMCRNGFGDIIHEEWYRSEKVRSAIRLDAFTVMPNHIHGIIQILPETKSLADVGARRCLAQGDPPGRPYRPTGAAPGSIGAIVGQTKSIAKKRINGLRHTPGAAVWQSNYYEHIVRNEEELKRIREYILTNPLRWATDRQNPGRLNDAVDEIDEILDRTDDVDL